ncbi:nucleotide exchange factor GrpE [uncultured Prevotella sp.]|uniref:nucleotide exchange factor GrpE n=1 Tax=uncultured Prevotella sp. TaxID=159272 RepID=UPI0026259ACC|nr:nucleotide exchange factor GrpE [uncultured Prevotella sp.]
MDKKEKINIDDEKVKTSSDNAAEKESEKAENQDKTATEEAEEKKDTETENKTADTDKENAEEKEEKDPLAEALKEIEQLKDKYLRSVAEFDNYRKRTLKEKTELILNGSEKAVQAFLPIIDDMERAIESAEKTDDIEVVKEGMKLIHQKTIKTMESLGVKEINTKDADFDTDYHEAVAMVPGMGDDKKGKVLDCVQKGYTLNDKVIRHAKVAVGQ